MNTEVNWSLEILKILPTFILGMIAVRIAWQQAETSRQQKQIAQAKLKLDLFSRRLAVYETINKIADAAQDYKSPEEVKLAIKELIRLIHDVEFLFGDIPKQLVLELCNNVGTLGMALGETMKAGTVPPEILNEIRSANEWIRSAKVIDTFRPYLDLSDWR